MNYRLWYIGVPMLASVLCLLIGLSWHAPGSDVVVARLTTSAPQLDGYKESLWDRATPIVIPLRGGLSRVPYVEMRALYDRSEIFFLLQWPDPKESLDRTPWEFDGTNWQKIPPAEVYEDKAALYWPIGRARGFEDVGCAVLCHYGGGKSGGFRERTGWPGVLNIGAHYTLAPDEYVDEWHWKACRTNPFGQLDDGYLDNQRPPAEHEAGGRHPDEPEELGGGYTENATDDGTKPAFDFPPGWVGQRLLLRRRDAVPIEDYTRYAPGDRVPALLLAPLKGKRASVHAKGRWSNGRWTLEIRRKLDTGDPHDVSFADLNARYAFSVAIFNAQEFEHSHAVGVQWLEFE